MATDFIDWCSRVLNALIEESKKSPHTWTAGLDEGRLFRLLFTEGAPYHNSSERKSMLAALDGLGEVRMVENRSGHFWKVTPQGREFAPDPRPLWEGICGIQLQSDHQRVLSAVNRLSCKSSDSYAWLEDVHHKTLLPELGESADSQLGEGGGMDMLWAVSSDLADTGLVKRDVSPGGHLSLTATYRGQVWETRRRLFEKCDVFISHITEEKDLALGLKSVLAEAFGEDLKVFVSSDYRSIGGGKVWYSEIVEHLKAAPVILVVLSEKAVDRRWINFEAGVGIGSDSLVIPLVTEGFPKSRVGLPLSQLQVRALNDPQDVDGVLDDVSDRIRRDVASVDTEAFARGLSALEGPKLHAVIKHTLERGYQGYEEHSFRVGLVNGSNATLSDYRVEVEIPATFLDQGTGNAVEVEGRRTAESRFFRMAGKDHGNKVLYPGDRISVFFMATLVVQTSTKESNAMDQKIKLSVFTGDVATQRIEMTIREFLALPFDYN